MTSTEESSSKIQPQNKKQQISNPRRLLILTPTSHSLATIPPLLQTLTGIPVDTPPTTTQTDGSGKDNENENPASFAGYTTHAPLRIETKYYNTDVPLWVDEIPTAEEKPEGEEEGEAGKTASPGTWKDEFCGAEARVVRDAIGGLLVIVQNPELPRSGPETGPEGGASSDDIPNRTDVRAIKDLVRAIGDVKELIEEEKGDIGDVVTMLVLVGKTSPSTSTEGKETQPKQGLDDDGLGLDDLDDGGDEEPFSVPWWEDQLYEIGVMGFEVVNWDPKKVDEEGRNRYGEYQGMRRIKEVLETHDWTPSSNPDMDALDDDLEAHLLGLDGEDSSGFDLEVNELEREMVGLRMAIERGGGDGGASDSDDDGDDEIQVESMEALMLRVQAIKDMSAELPENERKKFAAKAIGDIMKEM